MVLVDVFTGGHGATRGGGGGGRDARLGKAWAATQHKEALTRLCRAAIYGEGDLQLVSVLQAQFNRSGDISNVQSSTQFWLVSGQCQGMWQAVLP